MSGYRYTSWGRTRQPKNLAGEHGTEADASQNTDPSAATDGYATENQRYLHLYFENSQSNAKSIDVYGYIHAFGEWFILKDTAGTQVRFQNINNGSSYIVHEIAGVDRIFLKHTTHGANPIVAGDKLFVAGSTFQGS
tara:strand:- start:136 stop:546 length:411 start_codon:yes stop_codon:yes gene_type:complete